LNSGEVLVVATIGHLEQYGLDRPPTARTEGLPKDLSMLCFRGTAVLGCPNLELPNELFVDVSDDQLCHGNLEGKLMSKSSRRFEPGAVALVAVLISCGASSPVAAQICDDPTSVIFQTENHGQTNEVFTGATSSCDAADDSRALVEKRIDASEGVASMFVGVVSQLTPDEPGVYAWSPSVSLSEGLSIVDATGRRHDGRRP